MNFQNFQACMETVARESMRQGYQQGLADATGRWQADQGAAGAARARSPPRQEPQPQGEKQQLSQLVVTTQGMEGKLSTMECRQSHATPDAPDALRHLDQVGRGELWALPAGVARQLSQLLEAGIVSYGHAKAASDSRRGQYFAILQAGKERGARFAEDPDCQDAQGFFTLMLPQVRDAFEQHSPGLMARVCPVPEWASKAMKASRPLDTMENPVDQLGTLRLMGLINDKQYKGQLPLPKALQDPLPSLPASPPCGTSISSTIATSIGHQHHHHGAPASAPPGGTCIIKLTTIGHQHHHHVASASVFPAVPAPPCHHGHQYQHHQHHRTRHSCQDFLGNQPDIFEVYRKDPQRWLDAAFEDQQAPGRRHQCPPSPAPAVGSSTGRSIGTSIATRGITSISKQHWPQHRQHQGPHDQHQNPTALPPAPAAPPPVLR